MKNKLPNVDAVAKFTPTEIQDFKDAWEEIQKRPKNEPPHYPWPEPFAPQSPCPGCGTCPYCGRRARPEYPPLPPRIWM